MVRHWDVERSRPLTPAIRLTWLSMGSKTPVHPVGIDLKLESIDEKGGET